MTLPGPARRFLATLGFLSRLGPAWAMPEEDMRQSMFHLPLCGLVIGLFCCAPAMAGLFAGSPAVQAWTVVLVSAFATRGLHLDGLADVMDAQAAHLNPERFWIIIKDSRAGSFGVASLVLALGGQVVLLAAALPGRPAWTPVWCFVFGRACAVALGGLGRALARPGLGGLFLAGATPGAVAWALLLALGPGLALWPDAALAACAAGGVAVLLLLRLARAVGGLNGDFLGAAVVAGELAAAAGLALFPATP